ncbi:MAG: phenol hydroxylase subunit P4 [Candidatus Symbiobacter sp.]|nr:phenol hydroxylase subunit P4 [Candidatus Symbiobacter sp.]
MLRHLGAYEPIQQDQEESFYGNRLIYICWDYHLMFCAPYCLPLPPTMPFGAMVRDVLPELYGDHPEFEQIDWHRTKWFNSKQRFYPDFGKSLEHHGLAHKSLIRFVTPALEGSRQQLSKNQQGF